MKSKNVYQNDVYQVRVAGKLCRVRITDVREPAGFYGLNLETGRTIVLRSARRLRCNLTLRDAITAYKAALARGEDHPGLAGRTLRQGDLDGTGIPI